MNEFSIDDALRQEDGVVQEYHNLDQYGYGGMGDDYDVDITTGDIPPMVDYVGPQKIKSMPTPLPAFVVDNEPPANDVDDDDADDDDFGPTAADADDGARPLTLLPNVVLPVPKFTPPKVVETINNPSVFRPSQVFSLKNSYLAQSPDIRNVMMEINNYMRCIESLPKFVLNDKLLREFQQIRSDARFLSMSDLNDVKSHLLDYLSGVVVQYCSHDVLSKLIMTIKRKIFNYYVPPTDASNVMDNIMVTLITTQLTRQLDAIPYPSIKITLAFIGYYIAEYAKTFDDITPDEFSNIANNVATKSMGINDIDLLD